MKRRSETEATSGSERLAHREPGYRRALWIVVGLNVGYGIVEMIGGFVAASQAVKADALDFLGDGVITLLGLLAIRWGQRWRARAALIQGVFLGALGLGVLANAAYRVFIQQPPNAGLMGGLGLVALAVNIMLVAGIVLYFRQLDDIVDVSAARIFRTPFWGLAAGLLVTFGTATLFWVPTTWWWAALFKAGLFTALYVAALLAVERQQTLSILKAALALRGSAR